MHQLIMPADPEYGIFAIYFTLEPIMSDASERHFRNSTYREKIVEHIFVGELLRYSWVAGLSNLEILKPEVDSTGYDLVVTCGPVIRHLQLKASIAGGSTNNQKINASLANQPSGCVIWIVVSDDLAFQKFLWFGDRPGNPLPSLTKFRIAKNTRANASGVKQPRENTKVIPKGKFTLVENMDALTALLFGTEVGSNPAVHRTLHQKAAQRR